MISVYLLLDFLIPWDHHRRIIDKCKGNMDKALFFVRKTWENYPPFCASPKATRATFDYQALTNMS